MKSIKPILLSLSLVCVNVFPAFAKESQPKHKLHSLGSLEGGINYGTDKGSLGSFPGYQIRIGGNLSNYFQLGGDFAGNWTKDYGYLSIFGLDLRAYPMGSNNLTNPFISLDAGGVTGGGGDKKSMALSPWVGGKIGAEIMAMPMYVSPNKKYIMYAGFSGFVGYSTLNEFNVGLNVSFKPYFSEKL